MASRLRPRPDPSIDDRVLHVLRTTGNMTTTDVARALNLDRVPVRAALLRLQRRAMIRRTANATTSRQWGDGGLQAIWQAV